MNTWLWSIPVIIIILLAIRLADRITQHRQPNEMQMIEHLGGGDTRDWYAPFDGRSLDEHERNHYEQAMLARACALVEQRRSGRWSGRHVTVDWHPGLDHDADSQANWLIKHGARWGVTVRRVG